MGFSISLRSTYWAKSSRRENAKQQVSQVLKLETFSLNFSRAMRSILIIHSPTFAESFTEVFTNLGWKVDSCTTHECATRQIVGSEPYSVILLSYQAIGIDGIPLVRFIRSLDHRMTTGVVMIADSVDVTDEAKAAGVDEVLASPVTVSSLIWAATQHLP